MRIRLLLLAILLVGCVARSTPQATPNTVETARAANTLQPTATEYRPTASLLPTYTRTPMPGTSPLASPTRPWPLFSVDIIYQPSPVNPCGASYILGMLTDMEGQPITSSRFVIHVEGDGDIDTGYALHPGEQYRGTRVEGRSPFTSMGFGPSAWSVVLSQTGTAVGTWHVWLTRDSQLSQLVRVHLRPDCTTSSAVVQFRQNH
jgi:hypothetical protein